MKKNLFLCMAISVGLVLGGCANQTGPATASSTANSGIPSGATPGLAGGSAAGGGGGGGFPTKTLP